MHSLKLLQMLIFLFLKVRIVENAACLYYANIISVTRLRALNVLFSRFQEACKAPPTVSSF